MSRGDVAELVKIVFIETKYVETDATSFKSVVQQLTGKDSVVGVEQKIKVEKRAVNLSRGVSFKEFDRLIMDLPPFDELLSSLH